MQQPSLKHLIRGSADVHPLPVLFVRGKLVVVDSTILDGVARDVSVHHVVFQPHALAADRKQSEHDFGMFGRVKYYLLRGSGVV